MASNNPEYTPYVLPESPVCEKVDKESYENDQRLKLILDQLPCAFITFDANRRYTRRQGSVLEYTAYKDADFTGKTIDEIDFPFDKVPFNIAFDRALEGIPSKFEYTYPSGHTIILSVAPLKDSEGGITGIICVALDITEQKKAQSDAAEAQYLAKMSQESERLKTEFLSMVSHELRSPLTAVKGLATSLLRKDMVLDEKTRRDFLECINSETDRLTRLINDLLDITSMETGHFTLRRDYYQPDEIISSIEVELNDITRDHIFSFHVEPSLSRVFVDRARINQVILNLVNNAAKFSPKGTLINLSVYSEKNSNVTFSVQDFGQGIPPEEYEHVFTRFFQGSQNAVEGKHGVGLGLPICQGIVEAHGGTIGFVSQVRKGTIFWFKIPKVKVS
ncbi:MAG: ATP-binding protein [Dehalogenimonas sp.]